MSSLVLSGADREGRLLPDLLSREAWGIRRAETQLARHSLRRAKDVERLRIDVEANADMHYGTASVEMDTSEKLSFRAGDSLTNQEICARRLGGLLVANDRELQLALGRRR